MTVDTDDAAMAELMQKWDAENNVEDVTDSDADDDDDDICLGYDDMLEKFRRDVTVTNNAFDHVVLGAPDLDQAW